MDKTCTIRGCRRSHYARGWCKPHYKRQRRHGDPLAGRVSPGEPLRWLQQHISYQDDECLIWPFKRSSEGYAYLNGPASRVMCALAHGEPPTPKHEAAHSCGNGVGGCINPRHLRWATRTENEADKVNHGTLCSGIRHHQARLTEAQVREIRALKGVFPVRIIAARFNVSGQNIYAIHRGYTWKHV